MKHFHHILHIDDDFFIRNIIQHTLSSEFELTSVENGVEAMIWLEKGNVPDVILTDLRMPLMSGQEVISFIRSGSLYRNVPIIVLSTLEDTALRVKCIDQGADDFIVKPFNPLEVKARIKALLRRAAGRRQEVEVQPNVGSTRLSPLQQ